MWQTYAGHGVPAHPAYALQSHSPVRLPYQSWCANTRGTICCVPRITGKEKQPQERGRGHHKKGKTRNTGNHQKKQGDTGEREDTRGSNPKNRATQGKQLLMHLSQAISVNPFSGSRATTQKVYRVTSQGKSRRREGRKGEGREGEGWCTRAPPSMHQPPPHGRVKT